MNAHELLEIYKKVDSWEYDVTDGGYVAILYDDKHKQLDVVYVEELVDEFLNIFGIDADYEIDESEGTVHILNEDGEEINTIYLDGLVRQYIGKVIHLLEEGC